MSLADEPWFEMAAKLEASAWRYMVFSDGECSTLYARYVRNGKRNICFASIYTDEFHLRQSLV